MLPEFSSIISDFFPFASAFELIPESSSANVPKTLTLRSQSMLWLAVSGLAFSFILIALSNVGPNKILSVFWRVLYKNSTIEKMVQEEFNLKSMSSILLLFNFVVTTSLLMYLSCLYFFSGYIDSMLFVFPVVPIYFFTWPIIWYLLIGFLTGEGKMLSENKKNVILLAQILGILFSLLLLIWTFNLQWSSYLSVIFLALLILLWCFKLFTGVIFSLRQHIKWYYIWLYAITIEVLPLLLGYRFAVG